MNLGTGHLTFFQSTFNLKHPFWLDGNTCLQKRVVARQLQAQPNLGGSWTFPKLEKILWPFHSKDQTTSGASFLVPVKQPFACLTWPVPPTHKCPGLLQSKETQTSLWFGKKADDPKLACKQALRPVTLIWSQFIILEALFIVHKQKLDKNICCLFHNWGTTC